MAQNFTYTQCGDYISLTSSCHIQVHRLLENMAECVERFWNRTNQCFLTT